MKTAAGGDRRDRAEKWARRRADATPMDMATETGGVAVSAILERAVVAQVTQCRGQDVDGPDDTAAGHGLH